MFRNPRENASKLLDEYVAPSVGRPPSPPTSRSIVVTDPAMGTLASSPTALSPLPTLGRGSANPRKAAVTAGKKPKSKPNASILTFFKKADDGQDELFVRSANPVQPQSHTPTESTLESLGTENRFNEDGGSNKRQKTDDTDDTDDLFGPSSPIKKPMAAHRASAGPFLVDSDDDEDHPEPLEIPPLEPSTEIDHQLTSKTAVESVDLAECIEQPLPALPQDETSFSVAQDHDDEFSDFEDDVYEQGEEFVERQWMEEQARLEAEELEDLETDPVKLSEAVETPSCPICAASLADSSEQDAALHVNNCLDGIPSPLGKREEEKPSMQNNQVPNRFKRPPREPKAGQANPFAMTDKSASGGSAFSKLMSGHAEDAAWAAAAAAEHAARGKPAYQRTCPFYKILPGFNICVDAFRYGAVKGCQAYFLSHFHSDHYIGLTASWCHGPIYCSKVTGNLVKQQLRVDPKYVVSLDWEQRVEVPGTNGVFVTMISANHCPGSSLFLYEKVMGKGSNPKTQRVLHCGDFRACQAHVEHPLLRPDVQDLVKRKSRQQKLDVCYLDTTYLNPKYAFPSQENVIKACADMCVSLNKHTVDEDDGWEQMKRERAGAGMVKFVRKDSDLIKQEPDEDGDEVKRVKHRGRLLVIVGTYSIGKERICLGIARALKSKIYAPAGKQRICRALEDAELQGLLTSNPREAQVHMTPLFEIRPETLDDYLKDYRQDFSRAVGFRPSGWSYRPPNSRFIESPSVQTILHSDNWKSTFSMRDLVPQRGSSSRASCFGVPYSEHSSFRELTMFCCALNIDKIIPTVNIGNAKSRERMKAWCMKWANDRQKNGLFKLKEGQTWS